MVTIEVSEDVWRHLTLQKNPGDSFNDVLERELGLDDDTDTREREDDPEPEPANPYADLDFPATVEPREAEVAIDAAVAYLQQHGPASMREIVTDVMPNHSLGYDVPELEPGDRYRGSWWRKVVKKGLKAHPDIEAPGENESNWRWVGEE